MSQMCWMASSGSNNQTKILHLRLTPQEPWKPYTSFPQLSVTDYSVPRGSKGYSTMQRLLKAGWKLMPSPDEAWGDVNSEEDLTMRSVGALDAYEATKEEWSGVYQKLANS